jgi:hypothetical protein
MHKDGDEYKKLVDIKDFPDLGGAPEMLETTTLSDSMQTYIEGIQSLDALEFNINYTLEVYETIMAMKGVETEFAVWFGGTDGENPTGADGKFEFKGYISIRVTGKGVNEVREAVLSIAPSTPITLGA